MGKRGPKPARTEVIWSANIAYAVGLMASDGNLSPDGRHLELTSTDIEQIENIIKCFDIKANVGIKKGSGFGEGKEAYRIQWGDVTLYKFLLDVGLTPNKSLTLGPLQIPDEFFFDFLRGSHDGDGSFYSYYDPRWKSSYMFYLTFLSASREHVLWIQETVERLCGMKGHITTTGKRCVMTSLKFAKAESLAVLSHMYPNQTVTSLSRKRLKISNAIGIVGESLPNA